jgi:hypothetical protein
MPEPTPLTPEQLATVVAELRRLHGQENRAKVTYLWRATANFWRRDSWQDAHMSIDVRTPLPQGAVPLLYEDGGDEETVETETFPQTGFAYAAVVVEPAPARRKRRDSERSARLNTQPPAQAQAQGKAHTQQPVPKNTAKTQKRHQDSENDDSENDEPPRRRNKNNKQTTEDILDDAFGEENFDEEPFESDMSARTVALDPALWGDLASHPSLATFLPEVIAVLSDLVASCRAGGWDGHVPGVFGNQINEQM